LSLTRAAINGWDVKSLMEFVGWRDMKSALTYVDAAAPFVKDCIERALSIDS